MTPRFRQVLDNIARVRGVRGAMLVASDDGLIVAEALMERVRGEAVAALAASLAKRFLKATESAGAGSSRFVHLQGDEGTLVIVPAPGGVLVVAIGDGDMNVGLVRLEMLRAAESVA